MVGTRDNTGLHMQRGAGTIRYIIIYLLQTFTVYDSLCSALHIVHAHQSLPSTSLQSKISTCLSVQPSAACKGIPVRHLVRIYVHGVSHRMVHMHTQFPLVPDRLFKGCSCSMPIGLHLLLWPCFYAVSKLCCRLCLLLT